MGRRLRGTFTRARVTTDPLLAVHLLLLAAAVPATLRLGARYARWTDERTRRRRPPGAAHATAHPSGRPADLVGEVGGAVLIDGEVLLHLAHDAVGALPAEDEPAAIRKVLERRRTPGKLDPAARRRLFQHLLRRGFSTDGIKKALGGQDTDE